jgi:hypothetical protein
VQSAATFLASAALSCNTSWGLGKAYPAVFIAQGAVQGGCGRRGRRGRRGRGRG